MALLLEFPKNVRVSRNDVYTEKHFNQSKNFDMILFQEGSPLPEHELNSFQYKLREDVIRLWEMIGDVFVDGGFKVQAPSTGALNNDFQVASGTCFLKGRACQLTSDILYSAQNIPSLPEVLRRAFWNSITFPEGYSVTPLTTPTATRVDLVVLTLSLYEVRYLEEPEIIDADLGVETSGRLKVVPGITVIEGWNGSDFSAFFDYYNNERIFRIPLARITREANNTQITNAMITDLRPFIIGEGMKHLVLMDKTGSVTIPGNLTVMGDNAILNVETYEVEDNEILLNSVPSDDPDIPAVSGGVSVKRGKQSGVERPYATIWWR